MDTELDATASGQHGLVQPQLDELSAGFRLEVRQLLDRQRRSGKPEERRRMSTARRRPVELLRW